MSWLVLGAPYYNDSEMLDTTIKQGKRFSEPKIVKAVRSTFIFYGDPTFVSLNMKIYNSNMLLLHTSTNVRLKTVLITMDYAVVETYFEFANVNLGKGDWFYFVVNADGYSGASSSSHIAWRNTYPEDKDKFPNLGKNQAHRYPLTVTVVDARFDEP